VIVTLNLHSPPGEATRRLITRALNVLKEDNRYVVNAMLNSGMELPTNMWDMGIAYNPPTAEQANSPEQQFWGISDMMSRKEFSCGDAAACESAIIEEVYDIPTEIITAPQGTYEYHALYLTPQGPVDPSDDWVTMARASGIQDYDGYLERGGIEPQWTAANRNPALIAVAGTKSIADLRRRGRRRRR
jgi:hypothetical protein